MKNGKRDVALKHLLRAITAFLLLLTAVLALQSCIGINLIGDSGGNTSTKEEKTTITLYDGSSSESFEVTIGKRASIDERVKLGYYSKGYYTEPEGGERYFSADGKSLSEWSKGFPSVFYVQYAPITEYTDTKAFLTENIHTFSYYTTAKITVNAEFANALKANLDKNVQVSVSFIACDTSGDEDWVIYYKNTSTYNEGNLTSDKIAAKYHGFEIDAVSSYKTYSHTSLVPAEEIYSGEDLIAFFSRGATFGDGKMKNIVFEISFK